VHIKMKANHYQHLVTHHKEDWNGLLKVDNDVTISFVGVHVTIKMATRKKLGSLYSSYQIKMLLQCTTNVCLKVDSH